MNLRNLFRNRTHRAASTLGKLGGQARARKIREPIRARARLMREQMGLSPDARLA